MQVSPLFAVGRRFVDKVVSETLAHHRTGLGPELFRAPGAPDRWLLLAPLAIFAGWLTAATGVSFGVLLTGFGWLTETAAALLTLAVVLAVALAIQLRLHRAPEYGLTVIWALAAVAVRNGSGNLPVTALALIGIAALALAARQTARR